MTKQTTKTLKVTAAVAFSFSSFIIIIFVLMAKGVVSFQVGLLMMVALVGLYFGFGVLIAVYRFINKLE